MKTASKKARPAAKVAKPADFTKDPKSKFYIKGHLVKAKKSSAGLGLFAMEEIPKGVCIIEYVGRDISGPEEFTSRSKYLFEITKKITIDGQARSNTARYINHSCRPNAEPIIYKRRAFILSTKKIAAGEEIVYDYGKDYWEEHIGPEHCRCPKCVEKRASGKTAKKK